MWVGFASSSHHTGSKSGNDRLSQRGGRHPGSAEGEARVHRHIVCGINVLGVGGSDCRQLLEVCGRQLVSDTGLGVDAPTGWEWETAGTSHGFPDVLERFGRTGEDLGSDAGESRGISGSRPRFHPRDDASGTPVACIFACHLAVHVCRTLGGHAPAGGYPLGMGMGGVALGGGALGTDSLQGVGHTIGVAFTRSAHRSEIGPSESSTTTTTASTSRSMPPGTGAFVSLTQVCLPPPVARPSS